MHNMEAVAERENMNMDLGRMERNKGAAEIHEMPVFDPCLSDYSYGLRPGRSGIWGPGP